MGFSRWFSDNWFILLQSCGIIGSLFFAGISLRSETRMRRVSNLLAITEGHRQIWKEFSHRPELERVLDDEAEPERITRDEEIFVTMIILHLNSVFYAMKSDLVFKLEGLRRDVYWFFSLPIPKAVWYKMKVLQNEDFVEFVESCRKWK